MDDKTHMAKKRNTRKKASKVTRRRSPPRPRYDINTLSTDQSILFINPKTQKQVSRPRSGSPYIIAVYSSRAKRIVGYMNSADLKPLYHKLTKDEIKFSYRKFRTTKPTKPAPTVTPAPVRERAPEFGIRSIARNEYLRYRSPRTNKYVREPRTNRTYIISVHDRNTKIMRGYLNDAALTPLFFNWLQIGERFQVRTRAADIPVETRYEFSVKTNQPIFDQAIPHL